MAESCLVTSNENQGEEEDRRSLNMYDMDDSNAYTNNLINSVNTITIPRQNLM